jgi:hypothetical protein
MRDDRRRCRDPRRTASRPRSGQLGRRRTAGAAAAPALLAACAACATSSASTSSRRHRRGLARPRSRASTWCTTSTRLATTARVRLKARAEATRWCPRWWACTVRPRSWNASATTCTASASTATTTCARSCSTKASGTSAAQGLPQAAGTALVPYRDPGKPRPIASCEPLPNHGPPVRSAPSARTRSWSTSGRRTRPPTAPCRSSPSSTASGAARRRALRLPAPRLREGVRGPHLAQPHPVRRPAELLLGAHQRLRLLRRRRAADGREITPRCRVLRTLLSEYSRLCDHLTCIAASVMELGAMTAFLYLVTVRDYMYEHSPALTGARVTLLLRPHRRPGARPARWLDRAARGDPRAVRRRTSTACTAWSTATASSSTACATWAPSPPPTP